MAGGPSGMQLAESTRSPRFMPRSWTPGGSPHLAPLGVSMLPSAVLKASAPPTNLLSRLNDAACTIAVYASQPGPPQFHARLASDWWPAFCRAGLSPAGLTRKVSKWLCHPVPLPQAFLAQQHRDQQRGPRHLAIVDLVCCISLFCSSVRLERRLRRTWPPGILRRVAGYSGRPMPRLRVSARSRRSRPSVRINIHAANEATETGSAQGSAPRLFVRPPRAMLSTIPPPVSRSRLS